MAKKITSKPAKKAAAPAKTKPAAKAAAKPVKKAAPKKAAPAARKPAAKTPAKPVKAAKTPVKAAAKPVKKAPPKKAAPAAKAAPKKAAPKKVAPKKSASQKSAGKLATKANPAPKAAKPSKAAKPAAKPAAGKAPAKATARTSDERKQRTDRLVQAMRNAAADRSARKLSSNKPTTTSRNKVTKKPSSSGGPKPSAAATAAAEEAANKARKLAELERPTGSYNGILLCDDVKPFPKKSPYTDKELEKLKEALTTEREQLRRELVSLEGVGREALDLSREHPGYSVHMAEHATDLQTAEANMGIHRVELERLHAVEGALERIEKMPARYGLCLACGSKIGIQRLAARPHAHLCMDCQQRYERIKARRAI